MPWQIPVEALDSEGIRQRATNFKNGYHLRCCDIVLYLATSLKTGLLAHHHGDFAELALDS